MELLDLNDDCLCIIFKAFTLHQQLILTKVCFRFRVVISNSIWSIKYRYITTTLSDEANIPKSMSEIFRDMESLNKEDYKLFYSLNVQNLEQLYISNLSNKAFDSYLGRYSNRADFTFYFTFHYDNLKRLTCLDTQLHDGFLKLIAERCPLLESLEVSSRYVTGQHMEKLRFLNSLSASNCNLQVNMLDALLANDNLTYLNISWNDNLRKKLVKNWGTKLRELLLSEDVFCEQFCDRELPSNLESIKIWINFDGKNVNLEVNNSSLIAQWTSFLEHSGKCIKTLEINGKCQLFVKALRNLKATIAFPCIKVLVVEFSVFRLNELAVILRKCASLDFVQITTSSINRPAIQRLFSDLDDIMEKDPSRPCLQLNIIVLCQAELTESTLDSCQNSVDHRWQANLRFCASKEVDQECFVRFKMLD